MEICSTMPSSPSPIVILSDNESDDDAAALSRPAPERFTSSLCTQEEVDALCEKHGVPREFTARPAGDRRASTTPPPGTICVYADALEAGLRFPLRPFFSEALSHFRLAPSQLTPNGWRVLVGFFVLCHDAGVPPSLAVFLHFFSLFRRRWCCFQSKRSAGALFTSPTGPKSERMWKRGFFFLKSPEPWGCPVSWGDPPSTFSAAGPVLSSQDKKSVAKLIHKHSAAVDLRTYLSETNLAAAFSDLAGASPPPPLQASSRPSEGEAVATAENVKAEPQLSCKKRKLEEVAGANDGLGRSELNTPPAAAPGPDANPRHSPVPDTHDGDSAGWEEARKILDCILTPSRKLKFAAAKPSDVVASSFLAMHQAVNYVSFALNYAQELEEKQTAQERDAAALREQLENSRAELTAAKQEAEAKLEKVRAELATAKRAAEAEVESAKTAAVQQFLGSKEYTRLVAEQSLAAYEQGGEDMKQVALRLNPRLDAAKLVLD